MLNPSTVNFLKKLESNNNKPWFEKHRPAYETAKADFLSVVEQLIPGIAAFDPGIADQLAKNCIFRINRDVRFSKDKRPYKNNFAAYFNKAGKKGNGAGYYLHIQPGKSFAAAGIWAPEPADLAKIRQEIDYNYEPWQQVLKQRSFKRIFPAGMDMGNALSRPPKGYTDDNPALQHIKLKSFVVRSPIADKALAGKTFVKEVIKIMEAAHPFVAFLNQAID